MGALYLVVSALMVSFFSATLDIVLDAFRVEMFLDEPDSQGSGAAIFVLGYRLGMLFSGAGALFMASVMSWNSVYFVMSLGTFVGLLTMLMVKEPEMKEEKTKEHKNFSVFLKEHVVEPFTNFMAHKNWKWILTLIFIYRLSDAYIGPMAYPFYDDMGFSNVEIAYIIKIFGLFAIISGGLYGGLFLKKYGIYRFI